MHLDPHTLGERLRELRFSREMTLHELARLSGLDIAYLSRLERGVLPYAKPNPETVERILDALGATPEEREAVYRTGPDPPGNSE